MMDQLLAMQEFGQDQCQSSRERASRTFAGRDAAPSLASPLQERADGLAITVLDGHRDQNRRSIRPASPDFDHGLHPDIDNAALERLHQIVQVVDFPFRENDEHLLSPFHHLDGVAFRLVVLAAAFNGEIAPGAGATSQRCRGPRRTLLRFIM